MNLYGRVIPVETFVHDFYEMYAERPELLEMNRHVYDLEWVNGLFPVATPGAAGVMHAAM